MFLGLPFNKIQNKFASLFFLLCFIILYDKNKYESNKQLKKSTLIDYNDTCQQEI